MHAYRDKDAPIAPGLAAVVCLAAVFAVYQIVPGETIGSTLARDCIASSAALVAFGLARPSGDPNRRVVPVPIRMALALGAVACSCIAAATAAVSDASPSAISAVGGAAAIVPYAALLSVSTAVWEETLFRGLLPDAFRSTLAADESRGRRSVDVLAPYLLASIVFALSHMSATGLSPAYAALRALGAAFFSWVMSAVACGKLGLATAVATHCAFDFACFVPGIVGFAREGLWAEIGAARILETPASPLAAVAVNPQFVLADALCLAPLAAVALIALARAKAD